MTRGNFITTQYTDPESYQTAIRAANVEVFPTTKGHFRAELTKFTLPKLWMQRARESLPRVTHASVARERIPIFFLTRMNQPAIRHSGMELAPGELMIYALGAEHHHQTTAPCEWASMSLTPRDLNSAGCTIADLDITLSSVTKKLRPSPPLMFELLNLHAGALQLASTKPKIFGRAGVVRNLEHALIRTMLRCLTEKMPVETSQCSHLAVMAKYEEYLKEHADHPVYLSEICSATHTSERTLRVCCHEHLGMGPMRYLWLRRMYLARRALSRAVSGTVSVTEIATEFGFWELGRFSIEYRNLFGETPSVTLLRPANDIKIGPFALRPAEFA